MRCGARVVAHAWPGFGAQKNFAVASARHDWVLCLDADERVSPETRRGDPRSLSVLPGTVPQGPVQRNRLGRVRDAGRRSSGFLWTLGLCARREGYPEWNGATCIESAGRRERPGTDDSRATKHVRERASAPVVRIALCAERPTAVQQRSRLESHVEA
jgi:hypothetical protein